GIDGHPELRRRPLRSCSPSGTAAFHIAAFGCETGGLKRTARTSSGRTPTACAKGTGVRRRPRFFIGKLKYDGSLVNMCLSIIWKQILPCCVAGGPPVVQWSSGVASGVAGALLMVVGKSGWTAPPGPRPGTPDRVAALRMSCRWIAGALRKLGADRTRLAR